MKKIALALGILFSISTIGICQTKNFIDQPYIKVSGYADTLISLNQIFIKIFISEKDTKDKISLEEMENKMVLALKDLGVNTEVDLSTNGMASMYQYYLIKQKDILKSKEYILKLSDAETTMKVFIRLEEIDISNVSIDKLENSEVNKIKNICYGNAVENSKIKAIAIIKPLKQTIGSAIHIIDNSNAVENQLQGSVKGVRIRGIGSAYKKQKPEISNPKIDFEKIKVVAYVNVKYTIK